MKGETRNKGIDLLSLTTPIMGGTSLSSVTGVNCTSLYPLSFMSLSSTNRFRPDTVQLLSAETEDSGQWRGLRFRPMSNYCLDGSGR